MGYVVVSLIVAALVYIAGRVHGKKSLQKSIDKKTVIVKKELDRIDAAAEDQRQKDVAANAVAAQDKLDQLVGKKPFDQQGAAALLVDAGVVVKRTH